MPKLLAASIALLLAATAAAAPAGPPIPPPGDELSRASMGTSAAREVWSAWDGHLDIEWNRELLADLGLRLSAPRGLEGQWLNQQRFAVGDATALRFGVRAGAFDGFEGGVLGIRGGYVLQAGTLEIPLHDFALRPRKGNPYVLDLVSGDGRAWFYVDRLMYEIQDQGPTLAIQAMDLRLSPELAARIGQTWAAGQVLAGLDMEVVIQRGFTASAQRPFGGCPGSSKWPGMPVPGGGTYQADVFMDHFTVSYMRRTADADGPGGSNGQVVFTPSSTLRNNRNGGTVLATVPGDPLGTSSVLHAADVAWHQKFTGDCAPYGNDQHPFLIWNLYRIDADGGIEQVGRSGVKHAFLTVNTGCDEHPGSGHILGRGCGDTYGTGNNDSGNALGPRNEILPATGQWGRCGSIYDPNCDASASDFGGYSSFDHRMLAREAAIDPAANPGASWLFESWYVVRDDVDIYNTMQTRPVGFSWTGTAWVPANADPMLLGPAIDRWVDPAAPPPGAASTELDHALGHAKVAVRTADLGSGRWRYDVAVMNFDFAMPVTKGEEPNLEVLSNAGFQGFQLDVSSALTVEEIAFADGDADAGNDWTALHSANVLAWSAPAGATLDWGTLFRFSFVANAAPGPGDAFLLTAGTATPLEVDSLVPGGIPVDVFAIGGTVSGLEGDREVSLTLNDGAALVVAANGPFAFAQQLEEGASYEVEVAGESEGQDCAVANGDGIMPAADITDVAVTCVDLLSVTAVDDSFLVAEDVPFSIGPPGVLGNDDPSTGVTSALASPPVDGELLGAGLAADGSFVYSPDADFCGSDAFDYFLTDGDDFDTGTITMVVACRQDEPRTQGSAPARIVQEGAAESFDMAPWFEEVDGEALAYSASGLPDGLAIDPATGLVSGVPATGTSAASPYLVEVSADDGITGSEPAVQDFTVTVVASGTAMFSDGFED